MPPYEHKVIFVTDGCVTFIVLFLFLIQPLCLLYCVIDFYIENKAKLKKNKQEVVDIKCTS